MRGRAVSDDELLAAVENALEAGETDGLDGGVHASTVADRLGIHQNVASTRLRACANAGLLEPVQGVAPDSARPRVSYLPPERVD